jgi:hypothetical protein
VADADELIADIRAEIGADRYVAIVIDTLNRSIAGSESRDEDMGAYVKAADRLREAFHAAVVIIHLVASPATGPAAIPHCSVPPTLRFRSSAMKPIASSPPSRA